MLTEEQVLALQSDGAYPVGSHRLYVVVKTSVKGDVRRSWSWKGRIGGKRTDRGLGSLEAMPMADALEAAAALDAGRIEAFAPRAAAAVVAVPVVAGAPTFREAALAVLQMRLDAGHISNDKHRANWLQMMERHVFSSLGERRVDDIQVEDVVGVLKPIRYVLPETANRLEGRMHQTFAWAIAFGYRRDNPADGGVLKMVVPRSRAKSGHFRSVPWADVPAVYAELVMADGSESLRLVMQFLVLTMARSGEVRGATWDEVDLERATWSVPGSRMKMGREWRTPLAGQALEVLWQAWDVAGHKGAALVFPRMPEWAKFSENAAMKYLQRAGLRDKATAHGFRSSGRSWLADEQTGLSFEAAEMCLAHQDRNAVVRAYQRSDFLELRRPVMQAWADFVTSELSESWAR